MMRMKGYWRLVLLVALLLAVPSCLSAQQTKAIKSSLASYFDNYTNPDVNNAVRITIEDIRIDGEAKLMEIFLNESFAVQPFTPALVAEVYQAVRERLQAPYNSFALTIYAQGVAIEQLIPIHLQEDRDTSRVYAHKANRGNPWVSPMSLPYSIGSGLQGRHLCISASHGRYYRNKQQAWMWQRPPLFCTTEDMLTQTFVVPYLIPMLQQAGAIVYSPRERDWQKNEVVVDNDTPTVGGTYQESAGKYAWEGGAEGFAHLKPWYEESDDPFCSGTFRQTDAMAGKRQLSTITWMPQIPSEGDYAVYVSYKTLPHSVPDACYTVRHEGVETSFRVNQQMGGGTWVYLGTFHFPAGQSTDACVTLSNQSNYRGVITADAVRFGGGMSNILRRDSTMDIGLSSGMPRFLEAARYTAMWSGIPRGCYHVKVEDDYGDDINARPLSANYVARGSQYLPGDSGLNVPIELCLAVHSDAGFRRTDELIGTLGIYTGDFYDGLTGAGLSRLTSRDLADIVMTSVTKDMNALYGRWVRRQLYNRNYGESREPQVPSMILEMFSHQNWADMRMAHDPNFKFHLSRAIYKGILRYIYAVHQLEGFVVQPLPTHNLSVTVNAESGEATLRWEATQDALEPTAQPKQYVIYTSVGSRGFDGGTVVPAQEQQWRIPLQPGILYRFRVAAVNEGGASMPSAEVCASWAGYQAANLLLVDGFQRLAGPLPIDNDTIGGFDMSADPGVIDVKSPGFCGYQMYFSKDGYGKEGPNGFGFSGNELEGMILAGNTHDYTTRMARDIMQTGSYNISSLLSPALPQTDLTPYTALLLTLGAERDDGYSLRRGKTFPPAMRQQIASYVGRGGSLMVSGAYIGSDMQQADEQDFTSSVLKYRYACPVPADTLPKYIQGLGVKATLYEQPNEQHYWVRQTDVIEAVGGAFSTMVYDGSGFSAATAYAGTDCRIMAFGFPLECITDEQTRRSVIASSLQFLTQRP